MVSSVQCGLRTECCVLGRKALRTECCVLGRKARSAWKGGTKCSHCHDRRSRSEVAKEKVYCAAAAAGQLKRSSTCIETVSGTQIHQEQHTGEIDRPQTQQLLGLKQHRQRISSPWSWLGYHAVAGRNLFALQVSRVELASCRHNNKKTTTQHASAQGLLYSRPRCLAAHIYCLIFRQLVQTLHKNSRTSVLLKLNLFRSVSVKLQ